MTATIVYRSAYGSTRDYANALAERLGVEAQELPEDSSLLIDVPLGAVGPLILLSFPHGPSVPGLEVFDQVSAGVRPAALCTVGMTLLEEARRKDRSAALLGDKAEHVTRFYLPGRLNYSELSPKHHAVMRAIVAALKLKPRKSDNDRAMIDAYGKDVDRFDLAELDSVVEWARANGA
ncbi:flavodoxin domain-containing protein [Corynebacterium atrinae]|uniref:flavodoxin domain-containing protein n=1 Tax=Corynebacterium atrinae TaxID=1336740 RepID=UPI0025B3F1D6|nr:flavodoxin domain-containing protein [Corynebacterium atrinae]